VTYSTIADPTGRLVFIDGVQKPFIPGVFGNLKYPTSTETYLQGSFTDTHVYLASRSGNAVYFKGDIAAMRIYGRKLNADEIAGNALLDQLLYN
jgi:hypothetical protein